MIAALRPVLKGSLKARLPRGCEASGAHTPPLALPTHTASSSAFWLPPQGQGGGRLLAKVPDGHILWGGSPSPTPYPPRPPVLSHGGPPPL